MKKYVKPELFYESFELSEQIASCKFDSNGTFKDVTECVFTGADEDQFIISGTYFTESNAECLQKFEEYCYHAGTDGKLNLFNS